jgi:hypothetical protein
MDFKSTHIERTSVSKIEIKLSLYEMNKDGEIYNSLHPSFLHPQGGTDV